MKLLLIKLSIITFLFNMEKIYRKNINSPFSSSSHLFLFLVNKLGKRKKNCVTDIGIFFSLSLSLKLYCRREEKRKQRPLLLNIYLVQIQGVKSAGEQIPAALSYERKGGRKGAGEKEGSRRVKEKVGGRKRKGNGGR